jgi:hypothetical protein
VEQGHAPKVQSEQGAEDSPLSQLTQVIRRQVAERDPQRDAVWQPRFAYAAAAVVLAAFALVTAPLWVVFYRISGPESNNGAGPKVADLVGLSMFFMGGLVTAATAWVIIVEMRGRVRMVDRLARTGERETVFVNAAPAVESAVDEFVEEADPIDAPTDVITFVPQPPPPPVVLAAPPAPAAPQSAAATLEASSKLLQSFSRVLRAFSQLPAQVAMLAVALSLFVGATVLTFRK